MILKQENNNFQKILKNLKNLYSFYLGAVLDHFVEGVTAQRLEDHVVEAEKVILVVAKLFLVQRILIFHGSRLISSAIPPLQK